MKNEEMQHTSEPWGSEFDGILYIVYGGNGFHVAQATRYAKNEAGEDCDKANARRIVACVNYCAGVETEALEKSGAGLMPILEHRNELANEIDRLKAQNAELAEALHETALCLACNATPQEIGIAIAKADDVLGKYEPFNNEKPDWLIKRESVESYYLNRYKTHEK